MARNSLKQMRQRVKEETPGSNGDSNVWNPVEEIPMGEEAAIHIVPFFDEISKAFWTSEKYIWLNFVNPNNDEEEWKYKVPCLEMYEAASTKVKCPVANITRGVYREAKEAKDAGETAEYKRLQSIASGQWISYTHKVQGFVNNSSELIPIKLPKSMFKIVHDTFMDEESAMAFEDSPVGLFEREDAQLFLDGELPEDELYIFEHVPFICRKTQKGEHNDYATSLWAYGKTAMFTDEQIKFVADNDFIDLRQSIPERPTAEQYEVLEEMAQISMDYAMGQGDGLWNPEWEEFGLTPIKPKAKSGVSSSPDRTEAKGNAKDRLRKKLDSQKDSDDDAGEEKKSNFRDRVSRRGAKKSTADTADTADADTDVVDEADAPEEKSPSASVSKLTERIRRKKEAAANA